MSKRFNNKRLLYILAALVVILILTLYVRIPGKNATLKSSILELDTTEVNKIILYHRFNIENPIEFNRSGNKWTVQQGDIISAPDKAAVQNIFNEVINLKPQSLAAISKTKWKEFELTDSLATRVKFINKSGKTLADLLVGKFNYKQVNNPYGGYGGNNVQGTTFVRLYGEKEIYAVEGFLSFFFDGRFDHWRDKTFISLNKNDIVSVRFNYPADSSFILSKKESAWFAGDQMADSVMVAGFMNSLSKLDGQEISDNFKPLLNPDYQMVIEGNNLLSITVKCYKEENNDDYIFNSSLNPDFYFSSKKDRFFASLFKPRSYFLNTGKK